MHPQLFKINFDLISFVVIVNIDGSRQFALHSEKKCPAQKDSILPVIANHDWSSLALILRGDLVCVCSYEKRSKVPLTYTLPEKKCYIKN